jgi:nitronate monooxygenase
MDGFECAGHPGEDDVPNLVLLPAAADVIGIPMLASGGFADGRGLVAALALGCEGINMGTRFMATREAPIHQKVKEQLVAGSERDTALLFRSMRNTARVFRNSVASKAIEMEHEGKTIEEIGPLVAGAKGRMVFETGDMEQGVWSAGTCMGLIHDIPTVKELVERIMREAREIVRSRLQALAA